MSTASKGEINNRIRESMATILSNMNAGTQFTTDDMCKILISKRNRWWRKVEKQQVAGLLKGCDTVTYVGDLRKQLWKKVK